MRPGSRPTAASRGPRGAARMPKALPKPAGTRAGAPSGEGARPGIEIDERDAEAVVGLLPEALAEQQAEDEDEQERHAQKQQGRGAVAQQQEQLLARQGQDRLHGSPPRSRAQPGTARSG